MKTALLIIDMQNFFGEMLDVPLPKIKMLNDFFNETSRQVYFTQHGHAKDELVPPIKNQIIRKYGPENVIIVESEGWELCSEVEKMAKDKTVVRKNTYDPFVNTRLYPMLRSSGIERVVICGVKSDFCCNTTARSAFCRGFETWFVSDACWSDTEEQHDRAVKDMETVISRVSSAAETLEMLMEE